MAPSYTDENFLLIETLAKTMANPPDDWPTYTVKVRARASKYNLTINLFEIK